MTQDGVAGVLAEWYEAPTVYFPRYLSYSP
jgi:hypothetical protein